MAGVRCCQRACKAGAQKRGQVARVSSSLLASSLRSSFQGGGIPSTGTVSIPPQRVLTPLKGIPNTDIIILIVFERVTSHQVASAPVIIWHGVALTLIRKTCPDHLYV
jgi:hypothetical protein